MPAFDLVSPGDIKCKDQIDTHGWGSPRKVNGAIPHRMVSGIFVLASILFE
jgi:hypothetical protein